MSKEMPPYFVEPRKSGRTQIRDKYNDLICRTGDEWSRDKIFEAITELEQLRKERDNLSVRYGDAWFDGFLRAKSIQCEDGNLEDYSKESILGLSEHAEGLRAETEPAELNKLRKELEDVKRERDFLSDTVDQLSDHITEAELQASSLDCKLAEANKKIIQLDKAVCEEIESRDHWEERASKLAYAVGVYFDESVGEHSSANCPINNAHELLNQI